MSKLAADFHADDFARHYYFHATVFLPARSGTVVGDWGSLAKSP
jgi:hypothetical protein